MKNQWVVVLDEYEAANLAALLDWVNESGGPLNSGDWVNQIRWKLPYKHEMIEPNPGMREPIMFDPKYTDEDVERQMREAADEDALIERIVQAVDNCFEPAIGEMQDGDALLDDIYREVRLAIRGEGGYT